MYSAVTLDFLLFIIRFSIFVRDKAAAGLPFYDIRMMEAINQYRQLVRSASGGADLVILSIILGMCIWW
jgi:hypothetical protein